MSSTESAKRFSAAVVIGRFQPFHAAHLKLVQRALDIAHRVVIVLGSHRGSVTVKNPWTTAQRQAMVAASVPVSLDRVLFAPVRDYTYNDDLWVVAVQQAVVNALGDDLRPSDRIALVGHSKDRTCYYLALFPQWDLSEVHFDSYGGSDAVNATSIRNDLFCGGDAYMRACPRGVADYVAAWKASPDFSRLREEAEFVSSYRKAWAQAPYPPTFVTTDAVVVCSGHVLVVRRKAQPGRGSIALPGGFLRENDTVIDNALRELKEETGILFPKSNLRQLMRGSAVFDHPERSLRGRTVTHAVFIRLPDGPPPRVKGGDDAAKAWWMPISDVFAREQEFFEDHVHIISHFLHRGSAPT